MRKYFVWSLKLLIVLTLAELAFLPAVEGPHYSFADPSRQPLDMDPKGLPLAFLAIGISLSLMGLYLLWLRQRRRRRASSTPTQ